MLNPSVSFFGDVDFVPIWVVEQACRQSVEFFHSLTKAQRDWVEAHGEPMTTEQQVELWRLG
jgi:hypothetical protein